MKCSNCYGTVANFLVDKDKRIAELEKQVAELLQASEPVGYISEQGLSDLQKGFYGVSIFEYSNLRKVPVFTSPPNTQAKLDKAREALSSLVNSCESANERCLDQIGMGLIDLIMISKAKAAIEETK